MDNINRPEIKYDVRTGHLTTGLIAGLKNSISNYIAKNKRIYIGITNNPEKRNCKHRQYGKDHTGMIVLFQSSSNAVCKRLEQILIDYYRECAEYCDWIGNGCRGGGGLDGAAGPYYLYILVWR